MALLQPVIRGRLAGYQGRVSWPLETAGSPLVMVISSPWSGVYPSVKVAISATSRASGAVVTKALCLVFNLIMTSAIIALLLASVDNSAADAVGMPANLAFQRPGRCRALSRQQEHLQSGAGPLWGFCGAACIEANPTARRNPGTSLGSSVCRQSNFRCSDIERVEV